MRYSIGTIVWLLSFGIVLVWSGISPTDRFTWWLEVAPALLALPVLALTRKRFPLTPLAYSLILAHCVILMVGGHYTYAQVPLFDWLREPLGWTRNNYDKLGHLAQGFVPALVAREVFLRLRAVKPGEWLAFITLCFALALSAAYELVEWAVSVCTGEGADEFLGTQGYIWDTQSDMLMALVGAGLALILLSRMHDRALRKRGWIDAE
ncbi:MAG: DUF2238 domain-containing protein [Opitutales bacterium]|nr:DUF2238 domain-containing protein [Opitutales bacterium]